jgi:hypothetical protein
MTTPSAVRRCLLALALAGCSSSTEPTTVIFQNDPCLPSATVSLSVAQTLRLDCANGGTTVTFAGAGASYLIVPEFATDQAPFQLVSYHVASGTVAAAAAAASRVRAAAPVRGAMALDGVVPASWYPGGAQLAADRALRARTRALALAGAFRSSRLAAAVMPHAPPTLGSIRTFHVLTSVSPATFQAVAARLDYVGNGVLLYMDTLAPANGFTPTQLQTFGQHFDDTLYPIDTTAFGAPTDIDANGRVIMLLSPAVNAATPAATCTSQGYIAGFFAPFDFNPSDPNSNQGEIFYSIVPDPVGTVSCIHSVAEVDFAVPAVFLHELQHLINFGQHVVVSGGQPGASWLDEGMSIVAEELGSVHYEQLCPPPACRTNPAQLFPDSSQGFIQSMLYDSYQYARLPDTASITLSDDGSPGISWRGGTWLLARYLGDQFGSGVYRQLENGPSGGVADIEQVSGRSFPALFADFGLALYTDSLPGLPRTTAPAVNRFTSRNVKQLWARLFATSGGSPDVPLEEPVQLFAVTPDTATAIMYPGTTTFFRLDTPASAPTVTIRFAAPGGAAFPASLKPQIAVFRLPSGQ